MTAHSWRTITADAVGSVLLSCTRCGAQTNNAMLADIHNNCPAGDATPTESMIGFDADGIPDEKTTSFSERLRALHYTEPVLPPRKDIPYMPPERVSEMLARCNHICRTPNCGQVVDKCGDNCADCRDEIAALRDCDGAAPGWERLLVGIILTLCAVIIVALLWKELSR